ncbi:hypothetical protein HMI56_004383 [Coelomomyces lativittatus]|nr:hypothetical protein HMI56_004383 [Coelomomyces lativittatus]
MENKQFYIKYLTNQPIKVETHYIGEQDRRRPLSEVGDLVAACKLAIPSKLGTIDIDELTLHSIVNGVETNYNSWDPLTVLGENGRLGTNPLIIQSKNDAGQGIVKGLIVENEMEVDYEWSYLSNLFIKVSTFTETSKVVESDREVKFKSKSLVLFQNDQWSLERGRLPDLRFQSVNIETKIQRRVTEFMDGNDFLGLLIGPTGCGKTHEMLNRAKSQFTVFIDAQSYPASNEPNDVSVSSLKQLFEAITNTWKKRNQDLAKLRCIAYAFVLSRMLFLKYLKEKYTSLTPTQFLILQLFNSRAIQNCFLSLSSLPYQKLVLIRNQFIEFECLFCVDEAHVLVAHLGDTIISSMEGEIIQQNGYVNENAKRGTLSVLLNAIKDGQFAKKVLFAGTSSKLRNIDNFGTFETKPVAPVLLNQFTAWDYQMALSYVSSYVDVPRPVLTNIFTDNYRPRILENFVYDLFCIGMNDNESPATKCDRIDKRIDLLDINDIVKESYDAVIHRFTRVSIEPLYQTIRKHSQIEIMLKLLLSSMLTSDEGPINCQLNQDQKDFFMDTIGSIYLISGFGGYSFFEGYVIDSFLVLFETELREFNLWSSLTLLKNIIGLEGKKTTAKGTPFEAVVLADLMKLNSPSLSQLLSIFDVDTAYKADHLRLPNVERRLNDEVIISERPLNVFLRPSNQFRPDILAFLSKDVSYQQGKTLSVGEEC